MTIAERIKAARKNTKGRMTQEDLARGAKMSLMSIRRYESGEREPSITQLQKIAKALGVEAYELMDIPKAKAISSDDPQYIHPSYDIEEEALRQGILSDFDKMNLKGKTQAAVRVNELSEVPEYQKNSSQTEGELDDTKE